jgi:hypothetical protein
MGGQCECGVCGEHFSGVTAFDAHQRVNYEAEVPVTCQDPASLGMIKNRHGRWAAAPDPSRPNPWVGK